MREKFQIPVYRIWKDMSLNDSLDELERAKLAVWDYPVSDKFTNMWASMESSGFPKSFKDAVKRIKQPGNDEEFAFIGKLNVLYISRHVCFLSLCNSSVTQWRV